MARVLYSLSDRRVAEPASNKAMNWAGSNNAYVAGRFVFGVRLGAGLSSMGPFGFASGLSMKTMAAMGDALHGVANGAVNPEQVLRSIFGENAFAIP